MIEIIYIEETLLNHPRVAKIVERFPQARIIHCVRYSEVFNPKAQNFRLQKQQPALILAEKYQQFSLPIPEGYGMGATKNYYFSHMLNCLYDCRYCFLQGMYQSAHYVLFINYEDFQQDIAQLCQTFSEQPVHFFSGYDCDSLALEPITGFAEHFLPFFERIPNAWLELRTKSTQIRHLLNRAPLSRCVVAFSLSPDDVAKKLDHKAPSLQRRLNAMVKLQQQGWPIGLRFDPIVYYEGYQQDYQRLFEDVFAVVNVDQLHSVSLGVFRLPEKYFKKIHKMYPSEKLFVGPLSHQQGKISYSCDIEQEMMRFCSIQLLRYLPQCKLFLCAP